MRRETSSRRGGEMSTTLTQNLRIPVCRLVIPPTLTLVLDRLRFRKVGET